MALKKCKECGNEVSSKADACPKCGAVLKKKTSATVGCLAIFLIVPVLGMFASSFSEMLSAIGITSSSGTTEQSTETTQSSDQNKAKLEVLDYKCVQGDFGVRMIKGTVRNNTAKQYGYVQVEINVYDGSGAQVGSTLANVNNLEPHGIWHFEAVVIEDSARSFKIKDVTGY